MSRVYRSLLFAPGSDRHKMEKAMGSDADAVIFDLEDAVAPDRKVAARVEVAAFLDEATAGLRRPAVFVRVNAVGTPWFTEDLAAVAKKGLAGVMVPKLDSPEQAATVVAEFQRQVRNIRHETNVPGGAVGDGAVLERIPFIESASGLWNFSAIARSARDAAGDVARSVVAMGRACFGGVDFALDIGARTATANPSQTVAKVWLVVQSRAAGWDAPIDTVYTHYRDLEGLRRETEEARDIGMLGKLAIHPAQVAVINEVFTPDEAEIAEARRIVDAFEASSASGVGASGLSGQMVEKPIAERARRILDLAEALRSE